MISDCDIKTNTVLAGGVTDANGRLDGGKGRGGGPAAFNAAVMIGHSAFAYNSATGGNTTGDADADRVTVNGQYNGSGGGFYEDVSDYGVPLLYLQAGTINLDSLDIGGGGSVVASVEVTATNLDTALGDGIMVNVGEVRSQGLLTLDPGSSSVPTEMFNSRLANALNDNVWRFNNDSTTKISIPANAGNFDAGFDLDGYNAVVSGAAALLINNGYVVDSYGTGTKTVISDSGALVKGAGFWQNSVQTTNGGRFQSGNSPGESTFDNFTLGAGGVDNLDFCINNAAGTAGPTPDANGQVSGWSLTKVNGDFGVTADAAHKATINLQTLANPTTPGNDVAGEMDNFDPTKSYSWKMLQWTGNYTGPTDDADLNAAFAIDTSAFANAFSGTFSLHLDLASKTISLVYTPNP